MDEWFSQENWLLSETITSSRIWNDVADFISYNNNSYAKLFVSVTYLLRKC